MNPSRLFLRVCRLWLVLANVAAGLYVFGFAAFYAYARSYHGLSFVFIQIVPRIFDFFSASMIVYGVVFIGHVSLCLRWLNVPFKRKRVRVEQSFTSPTVAVVTAPKRKKTSRSLRKWMMKYGPEIVRVRMLIEVALQTFQAMKCTELVSTRWINRLMTGIVITNCWFSLIIQATTRGYSPSLVRVVRLVVDSLLDLGYCIVVPLSIFYPYFRDYIGGETNFPLELYYTDNWYAGAISEMRQILMSSWLDCISKVSAAASMLYRMYVVDFAITDAERQLRRSSSTSKQLQRVPSYVSRILDAALLVWGIVVASLHIHAAFVASSVSHVDCLMEMRPWGSPTYSCAVLQVDCVYQRTNGDKDDVQAAISVTDPQFVQVLILTHCSRLEVPPIIQDLRNMIMLKVYNSTITTWMEDAALRDLFHPYLSLLVLPRVNMSELPVGLMAEDFPRSLWNIVIPCTNLTTIPERVAESWKDVVMVAISASPPLVSFPEVLVRLPSLYGLALQNNQISLIPHDAFTNSSIVHAYLDGNRFRDLPSSLGQLQSMSIIDTAVQQLPVAWTSALHTRTVPMYLQASGTPLCSAEHKVGRIPSWLMLDCSPIGSIRGYPIEQEDQRRTRITSIR